MMKDILPTLSENRKAIPLATGVLDYFPSALAEVAKVSKAGNDKHNPGQPLHHSRGKSTDHADSLMRHLIERGGIDPDTGLRHSAELAWRALALLQQELEDSGAPLARGAVLPESEVGGSFEKHVKRLVQETEDELYTARTQPEEDVARNHDGISPTAGSGKGPYPIGG